IIAIVLLWTSLDSIVKAAIEKYGSKVTQTDVSVSSVRIKLKSGEGAISGLRIGNPPGFTSPNAFTLGAISTKIDTATVTKDPVVIEEVIVSSPKVFYEINEAGLSNINVIKKNIQGLKKPTEKKPTEEKKKERNLIIRKLVIEGGQIDVLIAALGEKSMSTKLPPMKLTNIGKKTGVSPAEVAEQVLAVIVDKVGPEVAKLGVNKYLGKGIEEIQKEIEKEVKEKLPLPDVKKEAEETIEKLF
ncbi:MAG: hypothetical protein GY928_31180, partial [Colwellia sp.]|nr:hypothetical protein [Colwellia sp.]